MCKKPDTGGEPKASKLRDTCQAAIFDEQGLRTRWILLPGRLVFISSMYSSIEARALYPAQLMVALGWRPRSFACERDGNTPHLF